MRHILIGLGFLGIVSIAGLGCSTSDNGATLRNVSGTLNASDNITKVVAMQAAPDGQAAKTYTGTVDGAGQFKIALPMGEHYVVVFMSGDQAVGVLRFKDAQTGQYSSLLPVDRAPIASNVSPQDAEDEVEDDDLELGAVDNPAGDDKYEPANNPEAQVDSDDDGLDDAEDEDDDGDGDADVEDEDDDNDGVSDDEEDHDEDGDGSPDEVDLDDDGDGVPDESETESGA